MEGLMFSSGEYGVLAIYIFSTAIRNRSFPARSAEILLQLAFAGIALSPHSRTALCQKQSAMIFQRRKSGNRFLQHRSLKRGRISFAS